MGRLRLVEFDPTPTHKVRNDHGSANRDSGTDVGIKAGKIVQVADRLEAVKKKEAEMEAAMSTAAAKTRSFWNEEQTKARGGVHYVD